MTTAPTQAVTITLPGPPVAYAVEPARLVAWLGSHGWTECAPSTPNSRYREFAREGGGMLIMPRHPEWSEYAREMGETIKALAIDAGIEARDLAAQLAPPAEGPALQWAHASAPSRARPIALLDKEALELRADAQSERDDGRTIEALRFEGEAMEMEAAAAVLRGGQRG